VRALLAAVVLALALAGCQLDQPTIGGTVVSVIEADGGEDSQESPTYYEPPIVPEVAWKVEVRLDDGSEVTVTTHGRRYEPGERVRLLKDEEGELLL
jgi:outer membrane lipoprotein SlyB